jgi:hypothetical protein
MLVSGKVMRVSSRRKCSRWHVLVVPILGWCWLPSKKVLPLFYPVNLSVFISIACNHDHHMSSHPMHHLHKSLIQWHCKGINKNLKHTSRGSKLINLYVAFVCALHMFACMTQVLKFSIHVCVVYARL